MNNNIILIKDSKYTDNNEFMYLVNNLSKKGNKVLYIYFSYHSFIINLDRENVETFYYS